MLVVVGVVAALAAVDDSVCAAAVAVCVPGGWGGSLFVCVAAGVPLLVLAVVAVASVWLEAV